MGKKKEKIVWVDDGRTIADMSGLESTRPRMAKTSTPSRFRDIWRTYWDATRMMLLPTLVAAGAMGVIYLVLYLLFSNVG